MKGKSRFRGDFSYKIREKAFEKKPRTGKISAGGIL